MTMTVVGSDLETIDATAATSMVVAGSTPQEVLANAAAIAGPLKDLIEKQGLYQSMGRDRKTGKERRHVEVSGWQAAGAMLGALGGTPIHAETRWSRRVERDDDVIAYESRCEVLTIHGEVVGAAESLCSSAESNWRGRDEFAIKGMAETRAESRAYRRAIGWIISLAGFSPTPAEEMGVASSAGAPAKTETPSWAQGVNDIPGVAQSLVNLLQLAHVERAGTHASAIGQAVMDDCDQTFPLAVARAINFIADTIRDADAGTPVEEGGIDANSDDDPVDVDTQTDD